MADNNDNNWSKAAAFFERAQKVAETNNFDYAIDMYLEGLRRVPDAVQQGHIPPHQLALLRQTKGGKKPTMLERVKRLKAKTPLERMLNAEYLFAKDPDHLPYAEAILKAAVAANFRQTALWIADFIFQANNAAAKPSFHTYLLLKDSYKAIEQFDRAIAACQHATRLKPEDGDLADEFKDLTAELTVARGKYDQAGDFRKSIKDREAQEKLQAQQAVVKTEDYRVSAIQQARKALAQNPNLHTNIFNLAQALAESQDEKDENEGIQLLESAYKSKDNFSFKEHADKIRISQLKRKIRQAKAALEASPDDSDAKALVAELSRNLRDTELQHYGLCVENYPTDLRAKYEYGVRLIADKQYDRAIPLLQESQKDPRQKIAAMGKIGLCFFSKGWFADAVDIFTEAIDAHEIKDDTIAKELRYNLALSYEQDGKTEKALALYRKIAQVDFAYKDVPQRVYKLRQKPAEPTSQ